MRPSRPVAVEAPPAAPVAPAPAPAVGEVRGGEGLRAAVEATPEEPKFVPQDDAAAQVLGREEAG